MFSDLHIPADPNQQIPTNPLKTWRTLFEGKNLDIKEIIQFFQICSPFFISIEQKDSTKLGESNLTFFYTKLRMIGNLGLRFSF